MVNHKHYTYRVTWDEEDGEYVALCAEFPSLSYLAEKHTEALRGLVGMIGDIVKDMVQNGEPVPKPLAEKSYSGKLMVRLAPEKHRHLAMEAAEQGVSLNRLISAKLA